MNEEPETIMLLKLPAGHITRPDMDFVLDAAGFLEPVSGKGTHRVGDGYYPVYCREEHFPKKYRFSVPPGLTEGWYFLPSGEPTVAGDEVFIKGTWQPAIPGKQNERLAYRRRIEYDTLEPDELIEEGDQVFLAGQWVSNSPYLKPDKEQDLRFRYRRPVRPGRKPRDKNHRVFFTRLEAHKTLEEYLGDLEKQLKETGHKLKSRRPYKGGYIIEYEGEGMTELESLQFACKGLHEKLFRIMDVLDKVFGDSPDDPNALLPDFLTVGDYKSEAVLKLAEKYKEQTVLVDSLRNTINQMEAASQPLHWEHRRPTEEECRERWILQENKIAIEPGSTSPDWWSPKEQICILPPIAEPEPERRMVTQRRWLVKGRTQGWIEMWVREGVTPRGYWSEIFKDTITREVPE